MYCGAVVEICNGGSEAAFGEAMAMVPILGLCDAEEETPCHLRNIKNKNQNQNQNPNPINEDSDSRTQKCFNVISML